MTVLKDSKVRRMMGRQNLHVQDNTQDSNRLLAPSMSHLGVSQSRLVGASIPQISQNSHQSSGHKLLFEMWNIKYSRLIDGWIDWPPLGGPPSMCPLVHPHCSLTWLQETQHWLLTFIIPYTPWVGTPQKKSIFLIKCPTPPPKKNQFKGNKNWAFPIGTLHFADLDILHG